MRINNIIYIVETTVDSDEISGGTYIVRAKNEIQARNNVIFFLNDKNNNILDEKVKTVKQYYKNPKEYDVEVLQEPVFR